jgi:hypothetical protein
VSASIAIAIGAGQPASAFLSCAFQASNAPAIVSRKKHDQISKIERDARKSFGILISQ